MSRRHAAALVLTVVVGAAAALFLARRATSAFPISDIALTELYTREAAHGRLLVGPYSRFGWHHPGPLLFYLLAPAYVAGGQNTAALHAGAFVLSLLAVAVMILAAVRSGGAILTLALVAVVALIGARLPSLVVSPWNPHAVVLPALALLAASAVASSGEGRALPAVALLASFAAQADAALVPFAAVLSAAAVVGVLRSRRFGPALVGSAIVAILVWLPTAIEQVSHKPGNLTALWRFFAAGGRPRLPFPLAIGLWADAMTAPLRPAFELAHGATLAPAPIAGHVALAAALTVGAAVAAFAAGRAGRPALAWFAALSAVSSVVALSSVTRIEGVVSDHLAFWQAAIGLGDLAAIVAVAEPRGTVPAVAIGLVSGAAGLAMWLGLAQVARAAGGSFAITRSAPSAPQFAESIRDYLGRNNVRRPLFRIDQDQWGLAAAILLQLDREHVCYAVEDDWLSMFPDRFAANGREDAEVTLAATGARADLARRPGNVTVDASSFIHVEAIPIRPRR